ncbi:hypothetical protein AAFF_G00304990 [Aldrovandia affinis]|uniref:Uncharacterized protein n=1 Tax=Aldrovandia affinis TaxID=143900 RepID=A0AAD7SPK4_9TELE|nr:hypothetical protein AAFF_G00304990 [Aldrovandia affinis]
MGYLCVYDRVNICGSALAVDSGAWLVGAHSPQLDHSAVQEKRWSRGLNYHEGGQHSSGPALAPGGPLTPPRSASPSLIPPFGCFVPGHGAPWKNREFAKTRDSGKGLKLPCQWPQCPESSVGRVRPNTTLRF